jgi:hypothetical protein
MSVEVNQVRSESIRTPRASLAHPSPEERKDGFLKYEQRLVERVPENMEQLRFSLYPLDLQTAPMVFEISNDYVMPWSYMTGEHLYHCLWDTFLHTHHSIGTYDPKKPDEFRYAFANASDYEDFVAGADFKKGVAMRDAEFEQAVSDLERVIKDMPRRTSLQVGEGVWMPLPIGGLEMSRVPLRERAWLNRHVVELCEWASVLAEQGFAELPALDPHPLAWHRFYPPDTDWSAPKVADREVLELARDTARTSMASYRGKDRWSLGMTYWHVEDFAAWKGRRVHGDLLDKRYEGVVVRSWNDLVVSDTRRFRNALNGFRVRQILPPVRAREYRDYTTFRRESYLKSSEEHREAAIAELLELGLDRAMKVAPEEVLTEVQRCIIGALQKKQPQTADELAVSTGYARSRLFQHGGLKELMNRMPRLVFNGPGGYRLARVSALQDPALD